jgi:D-alanyl-D-alanine carboxypeptidase (penicillin-binding protein 5/6)
MLTKVLTTILILFNPFAFLVVNTVKSLTEESVSSIEIEWNEWEKWKESLSSALWSANPNFLPIRDWGIKEPDIEAKAAIVLNIEKNKVFYQRGIDQVLPIASITKLITALIVLENLDLEEVVVVSEKAIAAYGEMGNLVVNEKISVKNLLHALLMESSNDAAVALAETVEQKTGRIFIDLMNQKVKELGLTNTRFTDPSGYDPTNVSTVKEIAQLVEYSFGQPIIWQILKTPTISLSSVDGKINHYWTNTDELLNRLPNVIGGKTGYTQEAQDCLVLVVEQRSSERLISVVLGAQERFLETEKLIKWVEEAYKW